MPKILLLLTLLLSQTSHTTTKEGAVDPEIQIRNKMVEISRHLGVTCTECHDLKNFKSDKMPKKKTAALHMQMVDMINKEFKGKLNFEMNCFLCHRGKLVPIYKEDEQH
jgi:hypothetical protein